MQLSVIMATFGKAKVINHALNEIYNHLMEINCEFEVCVVIDGDFDGTSKELEKVHRENFRMLVQVDNVGKGASQRLGFRETTGEIVVFIDSDGQINPNIIKKALEVFSINPDASLVAADKFLSNSQREVKFLRRILSKYSIVLINFLFGTKLSDSQTGFKAYNRSKTSEVIQITKQNGYLMDLETMILLDRLGREIEYVPVEIRSSERSNINIYSIFHTLWDLFVLRMSINRNGNKNSFS